MSNISNFELTKPILLFDATWKENALTRISSDDWRDQAGDVVTGSFVRDMFGGIRFVDNPDDLWGIDWSAVQDAAWNEPTITSSFERIGKYRVAYLRFIVTVLNGRAGDAMLFLFNQPNTTHGSGVHAAVHLEIGPELSETTDGSGNGEPFNDRSVRRATAVEQHLIRGWDVGGYSDGQAALNWMKRVTEVRFLGLSRQSNLEVQAKCILLGGMF